MRRVTSKGFLLLVAALALISADARAGELLLMPYSCAMAGGAPVLTPAAPDEAYQIVGRREQQHFSACSPLNPDRCRQWTLYRFELICGGVRVPWISVAAAAAQQRNVRAWTANGRLLLQMPSRFNMAADDPCAREWGSEGRWGPGRLSRYCAERRSETPPFTVEMPAGFAPTFGTGVFVASGPPGAPFGDPRSGDPATAAPPTAHALPPPAAAPPVAPASPPTPPAKSARAEAPTGAVPAPSDTSANKPAPAKKQPPKAEHGPPTAAPVAVIPKIINHAEPLQSADPASASPPAPSVVPPERVPIPGPSAGQSPGSRQGPGAGPDAVPSPASPAPDQALTPAPSQVSTPGARPETSPGPSGPIATGALPDPPRVPPAEDAGRKLPVFAPSPPAANGTVAVNIVGGLGRNPVAVAVAMAGFAMLVLAAFAFLRQREQARLSTAAAHDFAALSLDGGPLVPVESSAARTAVPLPPDIGDTIPSTLSEALYVLGMGVTPDASEVAIKKVVDGLRLSWHPDYAVSAADRRIRELRTKQINAAWDIIKGKRPQA